MRLMLTLRSEDVPAPDRFAWWCELVGRDIVPTVVSSPHVGDFRATVTLAEMGPVHLSVLTVPEVRAVRTRALVRRSDPERYGLSLITAKVFHIAQRDHDSMLRPGDLLLYDTSQPYEARALPGSGPGGMLMLHFPEAALPLRPGRLDHLLAQRLPADSGMYAILAGYIASVAAALEQGDLKDHETQRLGQVALDLAAAALAGQIDAEDRLAPETRRQALVSRIEAFIEHNLGDPELTPAVIAARHHISLAYLYRLFEPHELTVAAWIRCQRLERTRADLADPRLRARPVQAIAARWGFRYASDFNRACRTAYGVTPGDYRHQVLARSRSPVE
jgi:AraC-like DNA-binding protein